MHVAVVGAGLFGSLTTRYLRSLGAEVTLIDDQREGAGSRAAGCVVRPSWLSSMTKIQVHEALMLLTDLCGLRWLKFHLPVGTVDCARVEPGSILLKADVLGRAEVGSGGRCVAVDRGPVVQEDGTVDQAHRRMVAVDADCTIIAAGIWCGELAAWAPAVEAKWGWSFRGPPVEEARISAWAPYRQVVAFNMDDGRSWLGDGTAVKYASLTRDRLQQSADRCARYARLTPETTLLDETLGARPYVRNLGAPCLVERRGSTVLVTGGGKNGTAAAAWAARRVAKEVGL